MEDIQTREDLLFLMTTFYKKLLADSTINFIFIEVAKIDLMTHIPIITDFWEQNILGTGNYKNNVLQVHKDLNEQHHLSPKHFEVWLKHFEETIASNHAGENAEKMKTRALSIANVMKIKLGTHNIL